MRVMYILGYPGYPDLKTYISYLYLYIYIYIIFFEENIHWLVVSTPLKNISQWEGLSHILWKIINVPKHQPVQAQGLPHYPHMGLVATPCRPHISSALDSLISITETFRVSVTFKGHPTWKCRVGGSVEGNIYRKAHGVFTTKNWVEFWDPR